jgi:methylmalonyl-CoA mutase
MQMLITSYQGGHNEYFKYMYDLLQEKEGPNQDFGGGGGVILPSEIAELQAMESPEFMLQMTDAMGLQGMINDLVQQSDFPTGDKLTNELEIRVEIQRLSPEIISAAENFPDVVAKTLRLSKKNKKQHNQYWELRELVAQENHLL